MNYFRCDSKYCLDWSRWYIGLFPGFESRFWWNARVIEWNSGSSFWESAYELIIFGQLRYILRVYFHFPKLKVPTVSHLSSLPCFATKFQQFEEFSISTLSYLTTIFLIIIRKWPLFTSRLFLLISYRKMYQKTSSKHYGFGQVFISSNMYSFFVKVFERFERNIRKSRKNAFIKYQFNFFFIWKIWSESFRA